MASLPAAACKHAEFCSEAAEKTLRPTVYLLEAISTVASCETAKCSIRHMIYIDVREFIAGLSTVC